MTCDLCFRPRQVSRDGGSKTQVMGHCFTKTMIIGLWLVLVLPGKTMICDLCFRPTSHEIRPRSGLQLAEIFYFIVTKLKNSNQSIWIHLKGLALGHAILGNFSTDQLVKELTKISK